MLAVIISLSVNGSTKMKAKKHKKVAKPRNFVAKDLLRQNIP
jgi:hypothetical protein